MLLRMARLLYPHDGLDEGVYAEVLQPLFLRSERHRAFRATLHHGFSLLDAGAGGHWLRASPDRQVEGLARLEHAALFETVQNRVRIGLYRHPAVWKLIGYDGSSVEYGGYIHRGFDEIDWLPGDPA
jgi:hypothetical protein